MANRQSKKEPQIYIKFNYYELQLKLKELLYELLDCKLSKCSELWKIDLLITEAKSLIFNNNILYKEYTTRIAKFYQTTKTKKYKDYAEFIYKKIAEHVSNKLKEKDRKAEYGYKDDFLPFLNVLVKDNNNKKRFFSDDLLYFKYSSILAPYVKLTGIACTESDFKCLTITPNVRLFYSNIDSELMEYIIVLPNDIDFYISALDTFSKLYCLSDYIFNVYLIASSLCGVLSTFIDILTNEINQKYYKISNDAMNQTAILEKMQIESPEIYKLFVLVRENFDTITRQNVIKQMCKSASTVDKGFQKICEYFNVPEDEKQGFEKVKELAKKIITN